MSQISIAFLITAIAGFSTLIGSFLIFINKKNNSILISSLSFAAGVMICVSITDLFKEAIIAFHSTFYLIPSILITLITIIIGILFSIYFDKKLDFSNNKLYKAGIFSMLAIIMHNIPEGIITFLTSTTNIKLGLSLATAIALHNIPEGISISMPIYYSTKNKKKALIYTFISGMSEPLGAILAFIFLKSIINDLTMGVIYSFTAGIMIAISIYELIPLSLSYNKKNISIIAFILGLIFMYLSHILF